MTASSSELLARIRGSRRELARLLTRVENDQAVAELNELYPYTGKAHIVGITGAPGTGKSTLVNALAKHYRVQNRTVAILAVDPTSPFTGGALLGDRIRMRDLSGDPGAFVRSMATRGSLGGIARATADLVRVFDAAGYDLIMIETVGAGQSEVDVARLAQTTLVVEAPGMGDDVQAIKAGILEIADILVVNKADRPGVEATVRALRAMLDLGHRAERVAHHGRQMKVDSAAPVDEFAAWIPPIVQTVASDDKDEGIADLAHKLEKHRQYLIETGVLKYREQARITLELEDRLREVLLQRLIAQVGRAQIAALVQQIVDKRESPGEVIATLLARSAESAETRG
ncbi:MAG: methylmalonyl Co-A mutase-associated GTPase MeaB [Anaerolineae bacterium]|nr:methylmalonyl Co-A mutase-associated GTPase MeaB [Anaerolineae bacterium]